MIEETDTSEVSGEKKGLGWFSRTGLFLLLCIALLAYPIAMGVSHKITNDLPERVPVQVWADARIGTAIELLERETYFGWATDQPKWHPKAQLTAMPAFQSGVSESLSTYVRARISNSNADSDLSQAQNLLSQLEGSDAESRAYAAIEALKRYDGRVARSLLGEQPLTDELSRDIDLVSGLVDAEIQNLRSIAGRPSRGVFNREDVRIYYRAKGVFYASGMLMRAYSADELKITGLGASLDQLNSSFDRANALAPLTVSNTQPGQLSLEGNDVMQLAFLAVEVEKALETAKSVVDKAQPALSE